MPIDGYLELSGMSWGKKSGGRPTSIGGESKDSRRGGDAKSAAIELNSFGFGDSSSLAKAKTKEDKREAKEKKKQSNAKKVDKKESQDAKAKKPRADDDDDEDEEDDDELGTGTKKKGKSQEDKYRFQITKEVDVASPALMLAYMSGSRKRSRCTFDQAKVTLRKVGADPTRPKTYLTFVFKDVFVVAYQLECDSPDDPPKETIAFCFQQCMMDYKAQAHSGDKLADDDSGFRNAAGWHFGKKEKLTGDQLTTK